MAVTLKTGKQSAAAELLNRAKADDPNAKEVPTIKAKIICQVGDQTVEIEIDATAAISGQHCYLRPELDSESSFALRKQGGAWVRVQDNEEEARKFREDFLSDDSKKRSEIEGELAKTLQKDHAKVMEKFPGWAIASYRQGVPKVSKIVAPTGGTQADADEPAEAPVET